MHRLSQCTIRSTYANVRFAVSRKPWLATPSSFRSQKAELLSSPRRDGYPNIACYRTSVSHKQELDRQHEEDPEEEAKELKTRIDKLDRELKELESGIALELLTPEERDALTRARKDGLWDDNESIENGEKKKSASLAKAAREAVLIKPFGSRRDGAMLSLLNTELLQAVSDPIKVLSRPELWQRFQVCEDNIPGLAAQVPEKAWDILWDSIKHAKLSPELCLQRYRVLVQSYSQAVREIPANRMLNLIETLYTCDLFEEGLQHWTYLQHSIQADSEHYLSFMVLGVKLHVSAGRLEEAERLALDTHSQSEKDRVRLLSPVIEGWARQGDEPAIDRAWRLYLLLRAKLGPSIGLDDFDQITLAFFHGGRLDVALVVFKDLVLAGRHSELDSTEMYYKNTVGLYQQLQLQSKDKESLMQVSTAAMTVLPRRFQNKFFYASWIKRLIGMGQADAAASILDIMHERGIRPDATHLSGIMGAWLRSGVRSQQLKALKMGWAMVQRRLDFVAERRKTGTRSKTDERSHTTVSVPGIPESAVAEELYNVVSSASIETFSLLLLHYTRRGLAVQAKQLEEHLQQAEIAPNSYFMNHLMYGKLRQSDTRAVWSLYERMRGKVKPDLETFACLWDTEKRHLDRLKFHRGDAFPSPRRIFSELMDWIQSQSPKNRVSINAEFTRELYTQIILCFSLRRDMYGTLVALFAMRTYFGFYPDSAAARLVSLQVVQVSESEEGVHQEERQLGASQRQRRRQTRMSKQSLANVETVSDILGALSAERQERLRAQGVRVVDLRLEEQIQEDFILLAEFIRSVLRRAAQPESVITEEIAKTAFEMGVGGMQLEDAFHAPRLQELAGGQQ